MPFSKLTWLPTFCVPFPFYLFPILSYLTCFYPTFGLFFLPIHLSSSIALLSKYHRFEPYTTKQVNVISYFRIYQVFVSQKQISHLSCFLFPLLWWSCSYKFLQWSRGKEQGSLMWPLVGSPAVGLVFNQAPGLNSQQAHAPVIPTVCGGLSSQNSHVLL